MTERVEKYFPVNYNGHRIHRFRHREDFNATNEGTVLCIGYKFDGMDEIVGWSPHPLDGQFSSECSACGAWSSMSTVNAKGYVGPLEPCKWPGEPTVVELKVHSGKIILDDDLRDAFDVDDSGFKTYNSKYGQHQYIKAMAEIGCLYAPVGNTSPSLFESLHAKDAYSISSFWDEEAGWHPYGECLYTFCTDLWACSIADYQDFLDRGGKPIEEDDHNGTRAVMDFPNGTYVFTVFTTDTNFDWDGEETFATLYRKRD